MTEIINLRRARKQQMRAEKEKQAATNRAKFGRGKAQRQREAAEEARATKDLDGRRLDKDKG